MSVVTELERAWVVCPIRFLGALRPDHAGDVTLEIECEAIRAYSRLFPQPAA